MPLFITLSQGLKAASSGLSLLLLGLEPEVRCFSKPISNLGGMSLNTFSNTAFELVNCNIDCLESRI